MSYNDSYPPEIRPMPQSTEPTPGLPPIHRHFSERWDVEDFHEKFQVPVANYPSFLDEDAFQFRVKFMQEELNEFIQAHRSWDMHGAADALVDLIYVAHGTAHMMGLPWRPLWEEVQRANMTKTRATDPGQSKRGTALDVIKPPGWKGPDHTEALGTGPWPILGGEPEMKISGVEVAIDPVDGFVSLPPIAGSKPNPRVESASSWIKFMDGAFLVSDVYAEFVKQEFCEGLGLEEKRILFSQAMRYYVELE